MRQKKTKEDIENDDPFSEELMADALHLLPDNQEKALQALLAGQGVTAAAEAAGVGRQRVSYWLHHDPAFIANYRERRQRLAEQFADRLRALGAKAIDRIERDLDGIDGFDAAKFILRALVNLPSDFGKTLPGEVENEIEARKTACMLDGANARLF